MCFHDNQHSYTIKHFFIGLHFKYQSLRFICFPVMNSPVFPSLDNIYCIHTENAFIGNKRVFGRRNQLGP